MRYRLALAAAAVLSWAVPGSTLDKTVADARPTVELTAAPPVRLPGNVDSNSPAVWDLVDGQPQLFVTTSVAGRPSVAGGRDIAGLGAATPTAVTPWPGGGVWMEAIVADDGGTWYGYYHNENVARQCGAKNRKVMPRIGAARSTDHGATWEPLGVILDAPPNTHACATHNQYFVGGVGDLSVMLDPQSRDLYIFYSEYTKSPTTQGIGVARLAWADRDAPVGKAMVWRTRTWIAATETLSTTGAVNGYAPAALPIFRATQPWHDADTVVDAFWGPSVHWNTYLQQYVMLLNHAKDESFGQEGIYVSFATRLDDPRLWSAPTKILDGGSWYPQVLGLEPATGTDKVAGRVARLFLGGLSQYYIRFNR
jgi:hypothetical protein